VAKKEACEKSVRKGPVETDALRRLLQPPASWGSSGIPALGQFSNFISFLEMLTAVRTCDCSNTLIQCFSENIN